MIPGKIVRFLTDSANVGIAGTRDRAFVPHGHLVTGWHPGADGRTLTIGVAGRSTPHLLESLDDNGAIAVTIEDFPAHETYQFKGRCVRHRPAGRAEHEAADRVRARFVRSMRPLYGQLAERSLAAFIGRPTVAVDIDVEELYLQTPGPGAGRRLVPADDEPAPSGPMTGVAETGTSIGAALDGLPSVPLPDDIRPALDSGTPSVMVTCSRDGVPNATVISQVYFVDPTHVALSFQFFSKTIRNVREHPRAFVAVPQIHQEVTWLLQLVFVRSETSGPIFDAMEMQIEAIASATGMSGIFRLRAADIYRVLSVGRVRHED